MSVQALAPTTLPFNPVQASDIDAELERSLTTEWDAQIMTYPNERFSFSEWIWNRVRGMGYALDELDYLHEAVPRPAHIFEQGLAKTVQWYLRNAAWWQPILERGYRTTRIGLADRFDGNGFHREVIGAEIASWDATR